MIDDATLYINGFGIDVDGDELTVAINRSYSRNYDYIDTTVRNIVITDTKKINTLIELLTTCRDRGGVSIKLTISEILKCDREVENFALKYTVLQNDAMRPINGKIDKDDMNLLEYDRKTKLDNAAILIHNLRVLGFAPEFTIEEAISDDFTIEKFRSKLGKWTQPKEI